MNLKPTPEESAIPDDLCAIYNCDKCPGIARVGDLPPATKWAHGPVPDDPTVLVACTHECHQTTVELRGLGVAKRSGSVH